MPPHRLWTLITSQSSIVRSPPLHRQTRSCQARLKSSSSSYPPRPLSKKRPAKAPKCSLSMWAGFTEYVVSHLRVPRGEPPPCPRVISKSGAFRSLRPVSTSGVNCQISSRGSRIRRRWQLRQRPLCIRVSILCFSTQEPDLCATESLKQFLAHKGRGPPSLLRGSTSTQTIKRDS